MSKAKAWYEAMAKIKQTFQVADGVSAIAFLIEGSGPHLELTLEPIRVSPTEAQAVAFAHWLLDTFSEPSELLHGRPHDGKMAEDHA